MLLVKRQELAEIESGQQIAIHHQHRVIATRQQPQATRRIERRIFLEVIDADAEVARPSPKNAADQFGQMPGNDGQIVSPKCLSCWISSSITGVSSSGMSGLGNVAVKGWSRVPLPPANRTRAHDRSFQLGAGGMEVAPAKRDQRPALTIGRDLSPGR